MERGCEKRKEKERSGGMAQRSSVKEVPGGCLVEKEVGLWAHHLREDFGSKEERS